MSLTYYFLPTRNVFGEGAVNEAGKLMKSLDGTHPMIVTDAFLAKSGMADDVKKILEDEGLRLTSSTVLSRTRRTRTSWLASRPSRSRAATASSPSAVVLRTTALRPSAHCC